MSETGGRRDNHDIRKHNPSVVLYYALKCDGKNELISGLVSCKAPPITPRLTENKGMMQKSINANKVN